MANEAINVELPRIIKRYTVADGATIAKGTVLKLSADPNTAIASSGQDVFAGIAIEEKTASDGITEISAAIDGTWDMTTYTVAAGITLGAIVKLSGANTIVMAVAADLLTGAAFGKALETASASEVIKVRLGLV